MLDFKTIPKDRKFYVIRSGRDYAIYGHTDETDGTKLVCLFSDLRKVMRFQEERDLHGTVTLSMKWSEILAGFPKTFKGGLLDWSSDDAHDIHQGFMFADLPETAAH